MNYESKAFRNDTKLEGRYPNYLNLSQNTFEFVLGASHFYPENQHAQLYTRIVTSPTHAKAMLETIQKDPSSSMKRASGLSKRMEEWNRHRES
jgi:hypothetical protein